MLGLSFQNGRVKDLLLLLCLLMGQAKLSHPALPRGGGGGGV